MSDEIKASACRLIDVAYEQGVAAGSKGLEITPREINEWARDVYRCVGTDAQPSQKAVSLAETILACVGEL